MGDRAPGIDEMLLRKKIEKLDSSSNSIQTLSHWCLFYEKYAEIIVQVWRQEVHNPVNDGEKFTALLYLANDILQNCRRKGLTQYIDCFWNVMPACLQHILSRARNVRGRVERLVDIWVERRVFGVEHSKALVECIRADQSEAAVPTKADGDELPEAASGKFSPVREDEPEGVGGEGQPDELSHAMRELARHFSKVRDAERQTTKLIAGDGEGDILGSSTVEAIGEEIELRNSLIGALESLLEEQKMVVTSLTKKQRTWSPPLKRSRSSNS